jgi:hypothetical protein
MFFRLIKDFEVLSENSTVLRLRNPEIEKQTQLYPRQKTLMIVQQKKMVSYKRYFFIKLRFDLHDKNVIAL